SSIPPLRTNDWDPVANDWVYINDYGVSPTPSIGLDGTIYILGKSGNLHAITRHGTQISKINSNWPVALPRYTEDTLVELTGSPAIGMDGEIYVKSWEGFFNFTLSSIKPDGVLNWNQSIESSDIFTAGDPVLTSDGNVFVTAWGLQIINRSTGNIDWENSNYFGGGTSAIDNQGNIYVEYGPAFLTLERDNSIPDVVSYLGVSPERYGPNDTMFGSQPAISENGTLYVAGGEGLYVWNAASEGAHKSTWPMFGGDARRTFDVRTNYDQISVVKIEEPADGRYFDLGSTVTFRAAATDTDLIDISSNIEWVSNVDGLIGTGAVIQYSQLSDNYHEITARVTDSNGVVLSAKTNILVCAYDDLDADNLPDCYEFAWGLNPADPSDASADLDGDGLSNIDEFNLGTHIANPDTDYDHIPDGFEVDQGSNPLAIDSDTDLDGDGYDNMQTYVASVLPDNNVPVINIIEPADGAEYNEGDTVILSATANDAEDGDLGSNIIWSSDVDGALGTGTAINVSLGAGAHVITASVTDSGTANAQPATTTANVSVQVHHSTAVPGDVNGDGVLTVADVVLVQQHVLGIAALTQEQVSIVDLYPPQAPDGVITISDVLLMQQSLVNGGQ
ncbi:MAG: hypothetical protein KJO91_00265, partial [Gammaproteobacteria bacterium]|nr:hypothetical protein [Gammaproteobacteria bacterium]